MVSSPPRLRFTVPDGVSSAEIVVKNSVFIGTVAFAQDESDARAQVGQIRERYPDANHHAWAYTITGGPQAEIGSSDDGEPGGTAGRPMLAVLEGRGIVQAVAIGTRYFGGIKLGTGGLVRAYSDCIRHALVDLPVAEMVYYHRALLSIEYALYGTLKYVLPRHGVIVDEETFSEAVRLTLSIPPAQLDQVAYLLSEATSGSIRLSEHLNGGHYVKSRL
jgi:uncharacterized YigZ family protein